MLPNFAIVIPVAVLAIGPERARDPADELHSIDVFRHCIRGNATFSITLGDRLHVAICAGLSGQGSTGQVRRLDGSRYKKAFVAGGIPGIWFTAVVTFLNLDKFCLRTIWAVVAIQVEIVTHVVLVIYVVFANPGSAPTRPIELHWF